MIYFKRWVLPVVIVRSWNRLYAAARFGFWPLDEAEPEHKDHIELNLKAWHAYGYSDQDTYLRSIGSTETFLDYVGYGDINLALRDIFVQGKWGNRLDISSKIGGKENFEFEYQQKIAHLFFRRISNTGTVIMKHCSDSTVLGNGCL